RVSRLRHRRGAGARSDKSGSGGEEEADSGPRDGSDSGEDGEEAAAAAARGGGRGAGHHAATQRIAGRLQRASATDPDEYAERDLQPRQGGTRTRAYGVPGRRSRSQGLYERRRADRRHDFETETRGRYRDQQRSSERKRQQPRERHKVVRAGVAVRSDIDSRAGEARRNRRSSHEAG